MANCLNRGGGRLPNKGRYRCAGSGIGISGVNLCPGIRSWEVNFARASGFWQFLTKNVIFDKKVAKVTY